MVEFKIVISDPKSGKTVQKEVKDEQAKNLVGLKIGDTFKGEMLDLTGYEFTITGGSDYCGFPMRKDIEGSARKKILAVKGVGVSNKKKARGKDMKYMRTMKGMRQRVSVAGNTVFDKTAQINVKITKHGKADLFPKKEEAAQPAEGAAAPAEKPAEKK
ncbi:30S ribosomal protein S6e [Candidatus Woesearchaeota archaeon CG10_big_fil_rev_8_21_14_0_10_44_13]|nr:MAG: 30S ribosomal protein S6e [Candidatus Woesearchaeota archaeon CG10_big_fil_rev_8_21_14_0_10_44_13]